MKSIYGYMDQHTKEYAVSVYIQILLSWRGGGGGGVLSGIYSTGGGVLSIVLSQATTLK